MEEFRINTYLTIMVTVLVLTQIVRITQNAIQLHRHNVLFKATLSKLKDIEVVLSDLNIQRNAYRLIVEHFEREKDNNAMEPK